MVGRSVRANPAVYDQDELRGRAPIDVSPQAPYDHLEPDQELAEDGVTTLDTTALRQGHMSPEDKFGAPPVFGRPAAVAPPSRFGVQYSWKSSLHEHKVPEGTEIIEGGYTDRSKEFPNSFLSKIPDPSDAFMNTAIQAAMQNTGEDFDATVKRVEDLLAKAKVCVEHFGMNHACSAQGAGITFDYGNKRFSIELTTKSIVAASGKTEPLATGLVAYETPKGMYEGPLFGKVILAVPQRGP